MREAGKRVKRARLLEIHSFHRARTGHLEKPTRTGVANLAQAVVQHDVSSRGRRGSRKVDHVIISCLGSASCSSNRRNSSAKTRTSEKNTLATTDHQCLPAR